MGVSKATFGVIGETLAYTTVGGSHLKSTRHFCPTCGSLLFGMPDVTPDMVSIYVGSLDDPTVFRPQCAIFTRDRSPWDKPESRLTEYEALPD